MNEKQLRDTVQRIVLCELAKTGEAYVPVTSSNRHCHLSQTDVERLFGAGYHLTKLRDLVQPGQFACNERVVIETEKGKLTLRVVGPARKQTQIELSLTDGVKLGMKPPIRMSGDLDGSPGCRLLNGERSIDVPVGVIVAARHLHLAAEEAAAYGLRDGDIVQLRVGGQRASILDNVVVRCGAGHLMEAHIDKDEANACALSDGQLCRVERENTPKAFPVQPSRLSTVTPLSADLPPLTPDPPSPPPQPKKPTMLDLSRESRLLLMEDDVYRAAEDGYKIIRHGKDAVITPLARDAASARHIELIPVV